MSGHTTCSTGHEMCPSPPKDRGDLWACGIHKTNDGNHCIHGTPISQECKEVPQPEKVEGLSAEKLEALVEYWSAMAAKELEHAAQAEAKVTELEGQNEKLKARMEDFSGRDSDPAGHKLARYGRTVQRLAQEALVPPESLSPKWPGDSNQRPPEGS